MKEQHMFPADEAFRRGYGSSVLIAVCGLEMTVSDDPPICGCDHRYCPECVREAVRWNAVETD